MIRCSYCARTFRVGGLQEQLNKLYVHVMSRHPKAGDNKQDWYREEEEVGPETPEAPKPDAGDMATQQKWKNGAQGALTIMLHDGQWSVGVSGLNTAQIRDAACAAIKASYDLQQQAANVRGLNLVKP